MDKNCTPEFRCRNRTLTFDLEREYYGEIKAPPSVGAQVVGFVQ